MCMIKLRQFWPVPLGPCWFLLAAVWLLVGGIPHQERVQPCQGCAGWVPGTTLQQRPALRAPVPGLAAHPQRSSHRAHRWPSAPRCSPGPSQDWRPSSSSCCRINSPQPLSRDWLPSSYCLPRMPLLEDRLLLETFYFWTRLRYVAPASALNEVFTVLQSSSSFPPAALRALRAYREFLESARTSAMTHHCPLLGHPFVSPPGCLPIPWGRSSKEQVDRSQGPQCLETRISAKPASIYLCRPVHTFACIFAHFSRCVISSHFSKP